MAITLYGSKQNIIQVVSTTKTDTFSTTSSSFVDVTGLSVSITPSSTSSKILVLFTTNIGHDTDTGHSYIRLVRNSTDIAIADTAGSRTSAAGVINALSIGEQNSYAMAHLDSPATTSAVTYKITAKTTSASGVFFGRSYRDNNGANYDGRSVCSITVMEIIG